MLCADRAALFWSGLLPPTTTLPMRGGDWTMSNDRPPTTSNRKPRVPRYLLHKGTGQARVLIRSWCATSCLFPACKPDYGRTATRPFSWFLHPHMCQEPRKCDSTRSVRAGRSKSGHGGSIDDQPKTASGSPPLKLTRARSLLDQRDRYRVAAHVEDIDRAVVVPDHVGLPERDADQARVSTRR